jgi:uncharacterized membrane protein
MLASLLPGLRDVRTPLTVGYVWLFIGWALLGEHLPTKRPSGHGLIARLFDLHHALGVATTAAAVSFVAYLLGAMMTVPVEHPSVIRWLGRFKRGPLRPRPDDVEYQDLVRRVASEPLAGLSERDFDRALSTNNVELRTRLLVTNTEMYGEYDRLTAEADFRLNLVLPLVVLTAVATGSLSVWVGVGLALLALAMLYQGVNRLAMSNAVLHRAVLSEVVVHPAVALIRAQEERATTEKARGLAEAREEQEAVRRSQDSVDWQRNQGNPTRPPFSTQ